MKAERYHPATPASNPTRQHAPLFVMIAGLVVSGIVLVSISQLVACQGGAMIIFSTPDQSIKTSPLPSSSLAINTGTDDKFTVDFPASNGTSLPYLTFYNSMKYTNDWLWVKQESADTVRIGFTDYAQLAMGNFWSLNLPETGAVITRGATFGFAQGEDSMDVNLTAPVSGTVLEVNQDVLTDYYLINQSPYDAGWLVLVQMSNPADLNLLLTAAEYASQCCPPCHCNN